MARFIFTKDKTRCINLDKVSYVFINEANHLIARLEDSESGILSFDLGGFENKNDAIEHAVVVSEDITLFRFGNKNDAIEFMGKYIVGGS